MKELLNEWFCARQLNDRLPLQMDEDEDDYRAVKVSLKQLLSRDGKLSDESKVHLERIVDLVKLCSKLHFHGMNCLKFTLLKDPAIVDSVTASKKKFQDFVEGM